MQRFLAVLMMAGVMVLPLPLRAETLFLTLDPQHTHVMFSVMHLGLARTHGTFDKVEGRAVVDRNRPESAVVEVNIDIASLDSGLDARDANLMGGSWFDAEDHPRMSFAATGFDPSGEAAGVLTGDLTLRGVTRPVTLEVTYNGSAGDPFSSRKTRHGFTATGVIRRSDFGMDFGLDFVGDEITLTIDTEFLQDTEE
ncbi:YceI family protein [Pyruvatibacter mobilis]|uniref:YceI family protein n=1 Tax=Pyruvatibacter mobilis TaxID=1712261 RepID=UPI003BA961A8